MVPSQALTGFDKPTHNVPVPCCICDFFFEPVLFSFFSFPLKTSYISGISKVLRSPSHFGSTFIVSCIAHSPCRSSTHMTLLHIACSHCFVPRPLGPWCWPHNFCNLNSCKNNTVLPECFLTIFQTLMLSNMLIVTAVLPQKEPVPPSLDHHDGPGPLKLWAKIKTSSLKLLLSHVTTVKEN